MTCGGQQVTTNFFNIDGKLIHGLAGIDHRARHECGTRVIEMDHVGAAGRIPPNQIDIDGDLILRFGKCRQCAYYPAHNQIDK